MMVSGVLGEFLNNNSSRRHVDAHGQSFSCKHHLHQTANETLFDSFFEHRNHARVVTGNACTNVV